MAVHSKNMRVYVKLSVPQALAAFMACSNYTAPRGEKWARRSQSLAMTSIKQGLRHAGVSIKGRRKS